MRIKKYVVHSLPEAMQEIKQDLGHDAVILETRKVRKGGLLGWLSRKMMIEVVAAQYNTSPIERTRTNQPPSPLPASPLNKQDEQQLISKELEEMKRLMLTLTQRDQSHLPAELLPIDQRLKKQGIDGEIRAQLMEKLLNVYQRESGEKQIDRLARGVLNEYINTLPFRTDRLPRFICLAGPTGVGKTTTVAKLAADLILNKKRKVGLITSDTYRIAAVDQLKTYAQILDVPLEVVYSASDLEAVLERLHDCDHLLMDTAGRNYLEEYYIGELKQLIPWTQDLETFLVISLTSKYTDVQQVLVNFQNIDVHRLILTKLDETNSVGLAVNLLNEYQIPLAYVTTGQNVPDDIVKPDPAWLTDLLLGGETADEGSS